MVDLQGGKGLVCHVPGDDAPSPHLGEVPHPAEHPVGDAGRPPGAACDLHGSLRLDGHLQDPGGPGDDECQLLRRVQFQPEGDAEPVPQGGRQLARPGGGPDQGEPGQIQPDGVGRRALADDDVDGEVLHGRV